MNAQSVRGTLAIIGAALIWGLSPMFFRQLSHVPALDVLAHRMVWSLVLFGGLLALQGRLREVTALLSGKQTMVRMVIAALLVAVNWGLFIYTVQIGQTTQSSLGYYIYPLIAVVIGRVVFAEQLSGHQTLAVGLAGAAVILLSIAQGQVPWLALSLAASFGLYGMLKKQIPAGPVVSLTAEVMLLAPLAAILLLHSWHMDAAVAGGDMATFWLLVAAGPVTAVPLILFAYAARRLRMSTVGLLLYLNPTIQFGLAVLVFGEPFGMLQLAAFALIWVALAVWTWASLRQDNARRRASRSAAGSGTTL